MASAEAFLHRGLHMAASKGGGGEQKKEGSAINTALTCGDEPTKEDASSTHVSFLGEDVESIPPHLCRDSGPTAKRLDLSYNRLKTLDGLSSFAQLEELIVDNNELTDQAMSALPGMPMLHTLSVNKNKIEDTEALLQVLRKQCPGLRYLSLLGNTACPNGLLGFGHDDDDYRRYRLYVLYHLPNLCFLDSSPVSAEESKEAKRVGQFMRVVKPSNSQQGEEATDDELNVSSMKYTPLPQNTSSRQGRAVFGQVKYVYHGKHSEGNRFIRNNQL